MERRSALKGKEEDARPMDRCGKEKRVGKALAM